MKKEGNDIACYCPECHEPLGKMFQIEFTDEEWEQIKNKHGFKTPQEVSRFMHKIVDDLLKDEK